MHPLCMIESACSSRRRPAATDRIGYDTVMPAGLFKDTSIMYAEIEARNGHFCFMTTDLIENRTTYVS